MSPLGLPSSLLGRGRGRRIKPLPLATCGILSGTTVRTSPCEVKSGPDRRGYGKARLLRSERAQCRVRMMRLRSRIPRSKSATSVTSVLLALEANMLAAASSISSSAEAPGGCRPELTLSSRGRSRRTAQERARGQARVPADSYQVFINAEMTFDQMAVITCDSDEDRGRAETARTPHALVMCRSGR